MSKGNIYLLVALAMASTTVFAAKERVIRFQNMVRVGYDDNVYTEGSGNEDDTAFITDIVNISGKLAFSSRTDMLVYWQPEFRYRFDADPEMITYQDLYGKFNHAISQRMFLQLSDRFRYQEKEGQSGVTAYDNQNYIENDLMGSLNLTLNSVSYMEFGGGYEFRVWDDDSYGKGIRNNNYDQLRADGTYFREMIPNRTTALAGLNYVDHEYEGSRGGYDSTTLFGGINQNFSPNVVGNAQLGYSMSNVENYGGDEESTGSPFAQAGLEINPTARTSFTGSLGYSMYRSENSVYNAQDRFNIGVGVRHDLTGKISVSSSLTYYYSMYDAEYSAIPPEIAALYPELVDYLNPGDAEDHYAVFTLRGSYQINRNNFVDAGYRLTTRSSDSDLLREYDRNQFDIGWRLRL